MKRNLPCKMPLVVEKADKVLWGRVSYNDILITSSANSLEALKVKMKKLARKYLEIDEPDFIISFDLTSFFEEFSYLNISDVARKAGINQALMRQYASGIKYPSAERVRLIELAIREIGKELSKVRLHKPEKQHAA